MKENIESLKEKAEKLRKELQELDNKISKLEAQSPEALSKKLEELIARVKALESKPQYVTTYIRQLPYVQHYPIKAEPYPIWSSPFWCGDPLPCNGFTVNTAGTFTLNNSTLKGGDDLPIGVVC